MSLTIKSQSFVGLNKNKKVSTTHVEDGKTGGRGNCETLKEMKSVNENLHSERFLQLRLRSDCRKLQTRQAGRQKKCPVTRLATNMHFKI